MTATGKIRMNLMNEEHDMFPQKTVLADTFVRTIEGTGYSLIEIRMVVPEGDAKEMLFSMLSGHAEFSIDDASSMSQLQ